LQQQCQTTAKKRQTPTALETRGFPQYIRSTDFAALYESDSRHRDLTLRLSTDKLSKAYDFLWALRDISLDLLPGQLVALLGPNGAGKTTLLKLFGGLIFPTAGSIQFDGVTLAPGTTDLRRKIGLLSPVDHLYENLTVSENLRFFTALYRKNHDAAALDQALDSVNLGDRRDDFVANLSSGMKCRLSIAKWQLLQPELLLLDEPYGVLDGGGVDLLEAFLRAQCAAGGIVIMASHHVSRVLQLCNRAMILHRGRLTFNETKQTPWASFDEAFSEFLPRAIL
jgi:heme ABC exporter ATP-binding subunit CcmA